MPLGSRYSLMPSTTATRSRREEAGAREATEHLLRGMPEDGIAAFAWRSGARLIVVGCRPTAAIEHWALGCMAEEVSDTSLVPVLAVRGSQPFEQWLAGGRPLKVFAVFDPAGRPDALLHRIDELRQMSPCTMQAALAPYPENSAEPAEGPDQHAFKLDADFKRLISDELATRDISIMDTHRSRDMATAVVERAAELGADLLLITSHPRNDLTILPHRTLSHGVLRRAPMSVLCVPESAIEPVRAVAATPSDARSDDVDQPRSFRPSIRRNDAS